jgi:hypothetical protein
MYLILIYFVPLILFAVNQFLLKKTIRDSSLLSWIVYGATVLNLMGLMTVAFVRTSVGCRALAGECYAEGYYPNFDMLYILTTLSSLLISVVCVILIVSILLKTIWSRRFNA